MALLAVDTVSSGRRGRRGQKRSTDAQPRVDPESPERKRPAGASSSGKAAAAPRQQDALAEHGLELEGEVAMSMDSAREWLPTCLPFRPAGTGVTRHCSRCSHQGAVFLYYCRISCSSEARQARHLGRRAEDHWTSSCR